MGGGREEGGGKGERGRESGEGEGEWGRAEGGGGEGVVNGTTFGVRLQGLHLSFTADYLSGHVWLRYSMAPSPHLQNEGDNGTDLIGVLWRLNELRGTNVLE